MIPVYASRWPMILKSVLVTNTKYGFSIYNVAGLLWWHHQMKTFSALLAICAGKPPVTGEFPTKANDAELWYLFWSAPEQTVVNNWGAGDLGHRRTHYDVTVVFLVVKCDGTMLIHWSLNKFQHGSVTCISFHEYFFVSLTKFNEITSGCARSFDFLHFVNKHLSKIKKRDTTPAQSWTWNTERWPYSTLIFPKFSHQTPHNWPFRAR